MDTHAKLDFEDIQGIILYGYKHLPVTRYVFLQFLLSTTRDGEDTSEAREVRRWIAGITAQVTTAAQRPADLTSSLHLAFTAPGLEALGFCEAEMVTFPRSFQQGMVDPHRQPILGDRDRNDPQHWEFGSKLKPAIHAILILNADTQARLEEVCQKQLAAMASTPVKELVVQEGYRPADGKEHFGFHDGVSQPVIEGSGRKSNDGEAPIRAGEFILGYPNEYAALPTSPSVPAGFDADGNLFLDPVDSGRRDLGKNGSFLVFRKLQQDVAAFWRFAYESSKKPDGSADSKEAIHMAARIVGRWPSGASLVVSPRSDNNDQRNDFTYQEKDPKGMSCPIGAHVRRANPRDALPPDRKESKMEARRHRVLRRGRIYGPRVADVHGAIDDTQERGFQFIVINANINRQFEFVQQTWINSPKFGDLYSDTDPLVGVHPHKVSAGAATGRDFSVQREPVRCRFVDLPHFVQVRGGGYFFLPGIRGLRYLAAGGYAGPNRTGGLEVFMK
ncbi:MAG: peroxidase [Byssovorax sp.]